MKPNALDFWNHYELINSSSTHFPIPTKKDVCRYCSKTNTQTTFTEATHLLPELLGKNNILTYDECDVCNGLFSGYESHFSNFVRPYITLLGIEGKKKIPAFQSRTVNSDEETRTFLKYDSKTHKRTLHIRSFKDFSINTETKTFDITFRKQPHVPLKVYKSLLKIGLSLLPQEFDKANKESFDWLMNRSENVHYIPFAFKTSLRKKYFPTPSADLFRAKKMISGDDIFPEYTLILYFANQIVQIFLPFSDEFKKIYLVKQRPTLVYFPAFIFEEVKKIESVDARLYDLRSNVPITEDEIIPFKYNDFRPPTMS